MSSRYMQTDDSIVANSNFLLDNYTLEPVSFILKNGILVSVRNAELIVQRVGKENLCQYAQFPRAIMYWLLCSKQGGV